MLFLERCRASVDRSLIFSHSERALPHKAGGTAGGVLGGGYTGTRGYDDSEKRILIMATSRPIRLIVLA